jgi:U3 small nucleolar RNA-associated protein 13
MDQGEGALADLEKMIVKLSTNQKDSLLRYSTTWNTNSRHCHQAQVFLNSHNLERHDDNCVLISLDGS